MGCNTKRVTGNAVMILASILATVAAAADLAKTDPKTWSAVGYLQFKWGMGPGDVQATFESPSALMRSSSKLRVRETYTPRSESTRIVEYELGSTPFELGDAPMSRLFPILGRPTIRSHAHPRCRRTALGQAHRGSS